MAGKPVLGIAIGVGKPKPGAGGMSGDDEMSMGEEDEGGDIVAARGFIDAVKSGDPQAVIDSLNTLLDYLDVDEGQSEESAEMPEGKSMMED